MIHLIFSVYLSIFCLIFQFKSLFKLHMLIRNLLGVFFHFHQLPRKQIHLQ